MRSLRLATVLLAGVAALTGCFGPAVKLESTLPPGAPPRPGYVGAQTAALTLDDLEPTMTALREALKARAPALNPALKAALHELPEHALALTLAAETSFEPGSAQLRVAVFDDYAGLADQLAARGSVVAHVMVFEPSTAGAPAGPDGLAARRAATLLGFFQQRGVPGTRLRGEGRARAEPGVEIVLKPVIDGREAEAWTPPA